MKNVANQRRQNIIFQGNGQNEVIWRNSVCIYVITKISFLLDRLCSAGYPNIAEFYEERKNKVFVFAGKSGSQNFCPELGEQENLV